MSYNELCSKLGEGVLILLGILGIAVVGALFCWALPWMAGIFVIVCVFMMMVTAIFSTIKWARNGIKREKPKN